MKLSHRHWLLLLLFALSHCTIRRAYSCTDHPCSNDSLADPIIGDEVIAFEPPAAFDPDGDGIVDIVRSYELLRTDPLPVTTCLVNSGRTNQRRATWIPPATRFILYASDCAPAEGTTATFTVRACGDTGCAPLPEARVAFVGQRYCEFQEGRVPMVRGSSEPCFPGTTPNPDMAYGFDRIEAVVNIDVVSTTLEWRTPRSDCP